MGRLLAALLGTILLGSSPVRADGPARGEIEVKAQARQSAAQVNEGELVFLHKPPAKPVHHHYNSVVITEHSLESGWTDLTQCHENLDRVPAAQIVFNPERTRHLKILSYSGIGRVWVQGASVQLKDIGPGAKVCIAAQSLALRDNGDGTYTLASGPFMRKFLDGYYPMHVSMKVEILAPEIRFLKIAPPGQTGFKVWQSPGEVHFDAWFEGKLNTQISFVTLDGMPRF